MRTLSVFIVVGLFSLILGCGAKQPPELIKARLEPMLPACTALVNPDSVNEENYEELALKLVAQGLLGLLSGANANIENKRWELMPNGSDVLASFESGDTEYECFFINEDGSWVPESVFRNGEAVFSRSWLMSQIEAVANNVVETDPEGIAETVRQLERDAELARRRAEELAGISSSGALNAPPLTSFDNTYMEIERPLVTNIVNSRKVMQIKVAIMTHYDDRVADNMEKHAFAIRGEMLDVMRKVDESRLSEPNFRADLAEQLKIAVNTVLEKYEGFGGVEEVIFTEFVVQ